MVEGEGVMGSIFKGGGGAWETLMIFHFGCGCFYVLESLGVSCENKFLLVLFFFFFLKGSISFVKLEMTWVFN